MIPLLVRPLDSVADLNLSRRSRNDRDRRSLFYLQHYELAEHFAWKRRALAQNLLARDSRPLNGIFAAMKPIASVSFATILYELVRRRLSDAFALANLTIDCELVAWVNVLSCSKINVDNLIGGEVFVEAG